MRSGVILSGGRSSRMGADKGLIPVAGRPFVAHVAERLADAVDEVIIVVSNATQAKAYSDLGGRVVTDVYPSETPIVGAYTGLREARGDYTFVTAGDQPLLDPRVVSLLFDEAEGHDAATPTWPNGWVEPLHSVYATRPAVETARLLIEQREKRLRMLLASLPDVKLVPIDQIRVLDPELRTLIDVDTSEAIDRVRRVLESG